MGLNPLFRKPPKLTFRAWVRCSTFVTSLATLTHNRVQGEPTKPLEMDKTHASNSRSAARKHGFFRVSRCCGRVRRRAFCPPNSFLYFSGQNHLASPRGKAQECSEAMQHGIQNSPTQFTHVAHPAALLAVGKSKPLQIPGRLNSFFPQSDRSCTYRTASSWASTQPS